MPQSHVNISVVAAVPAGSPPLPPTTRTTTAINNPRSPLPPSPVSSLNNNIIGAAPTGHSPASAATLTISCQWENYDGILTAGTKGLVFTGSYYFFATILSLPWTDVRRMQYHHHDGAAVPTTGLVVTMRDSNLEQQQQEQQQHVFFIQLFSPAHLSRLMQLQNEALIALRLTAAVVRDNPACTSSSSSSSSGSTMTSATSSRSTTPLPPFLVDEREDDVVAEAAVDHNKNGPVTAVRASCHAGVTSSSSSAPTTVASTSIITTAAAHLPNAAIIELHTGLPLLALRHINVTHDDLMGRLYVGPKGLVFTGRRRAGYYYFWGNDHALVALPWSNIGRLHRPDAQTVLIQSSHHHHHDALSSSSQRRDYRFFLMVDDNNTDDADDDAAVGQDEIWETLVSCHNTHLTETHGATTTMAILTQRPPVSEIDRPGETTVAGGGEQQLVATVAVAAPAPTTTISTSLIMTADNTTTFLSKPLQHLVVSDVVVPCSLDRFEDLFLRDDAPYSLGDFLASRGDSDVQSSHWDDDEENEEKERVVRYLHPVNVPMAPPQARARKEQRQVRRQQRPSSWPGDDDDDEASATIIVETKTIVDDVPMTDCFYVLDRLTVTEPKQGKVVAMSDNSTFTTTVVQVRMEFEITFVKSTMFRSIIQKTTRQEFIGLFQSLAEYYVQCLVDPAATVSTLTAPVPGATAAQTAAGTTMESSSRPNDNNNNKSRPVASPPPSPPPSRLYLLLWAVTCLLQLWILRELREHKKGRLVDMTVAKFY